MALLRRNPAIVTDVRVRSVEQAWARGEMVCLNRTILLTFTLDQRTGALLSAHYRVQSEFDKDIIFPVRYDAWQDDAACACRAARSGHACWHRGAVLLKARRLAHQSLASLPHAGRRE